MSSTRYELMALVAIIDINDWRGVGSLWLALDRARRGKATLQNLPLIECTQSDWHCLSGQAAVDNCGDDVVCVQADCLRLLAEIASGGKLTARVMDPERCPGDPV